MLTLGPTGGHRLMFNFSVARHIRATLAKRAAYDARVACVARRQRQQHGGRDSLASVAECGCRHNHLPPTAP